MLNSLRCVHLRELLSVLTQLKATNFPFRILLVKNTWFIFLLIVAMLITLSCAKIRKEIPIRNLRIQFNQLCLSFQNYEYLIRFPLRLKSTQINPQVYGIFNKELMHLNQIHSGLKALI